MDGLDEVEEEERPELLDVIDSWIAVGATTLITARSDLELPNHYRALYSAQAYSIEPLGLEQMTDLIIQRFETLDLYKAENLVTAVRAKLSDSSLWVPSPSRRALSVPFYLTHSCDFYAHYSRLPIARHEVLKHILQLSCKNVEIFTQKSAI